MNITRVSKSKSSGFTLVEMLTVVSIAAVLAVLATPALQSLQNAGSFDKSVYAMADSLNLARSYAMANNTYVYVGLTEVNRTQNPGASPQVAGYGRVALSIVATMDGTSDASYAWSNGNGANVTQVRQNQILDMLHIESKAVFTSVFSAVTAGGMAKPTSNGTTIVPNFAGLPASSAPATPFYLPLGTGSANYKYEFADTNAEVICFNPQGGVLLNGNAVQWLEIDLQPMVGGGTSAPPAPVLSSGGAVNGNAAALVIDGVTGAVNVYRP